jgi:hypothetical protein
VRPPALYSEPYSRRINGASNSPTAVTRASSGIARRRMVLRSAAGFSPYEVSTVRAVPTFVASRSRVELVRSKHRGGDGIQELEGDDRQEEHRIKPVVTMRGPAVRTSRSFSTGAGRARWRADDNDGAVKLVSL